MNPVQQFKPEIKLLLLVALIAVVVFVSAIFLLKRNEQQTINNQESTINTSGWQTYRNDEFGFEVKYPTSLTAVSTGPSNEQERLEKGEIISGTVAPSFDTVHFLDQSKESILSITIFHPVQEDLSLESYREGVLHVHGPCDLRWGFEPSNIEEKNMLGHSVLIVQGRNIAPELGQPLMCAYLKNEAGNLIVGESENFGLLGQILSTFKVTDQAQVTPTETTEGKFCGGIAANLPENQCPSGYKCQLDGNYPDAGGKCVKL